MISILETSEETPAGPLIDHKIMEGKRMGNPYKEIKQTLSITDVLRHYGVRKAGQNSYYCPIHENDGGKHKPSLVASDEKGTATCMSKGCFQNADVFSFIEIMGKCTKREALHKSAVLAGISLERSENNTEKSPASSPGKNTKKTKRISGLQELQQSHIEWLESKRSIDTFIALQFGLKAKGEYIAFPHWKDGAITGWKLRSIENKSKTWQTGPQEGEIDLSAKLWHLGVLQDRKNAITHLIFVEGEPDCLLLNQKCQDQGLSDTAVVTCTAGAGTIPPEIGKLKKHFPRLKRVSIWYDNDKSGKEGSKKLADAIRKEQILIAIYSFTAGRKEGYDITDFFQEGKTLSELFELPAQVIAPYYDMKPSINALDLAYANSNTINTEFPDLDRITHGLQGLVVLGGETGSGKTTFLLNIAYHAAKQQHPVLYVSYELGYAELRVKLAAMHGEYGYSSLNKERRLFLKAREVLLDDPALDYFKVVDTNLLSLGIDYIQEGIAALKSEFPEAKIPLIVIDYLQGMPITSTGEYRLSLAAAVQGLRDLARRQDVVVLVASATNTQRRGSGSIHAGVFRESSEIEYSAYIALVLGYKEDQKENGNVKSDQLRYPYLFVVKNRFGGRNTSGIPLEVNWERQVYKQRERNW